MSTPDVHQDTLFYAGEFSSTLKENIFSLMNNRLAFTELFLKDAQLNIKNDENETSNNLQTFLAGLSNENDPNKESGSPLEIDLSIVHLENFRVVNDNQNTHKNSVIQLRKGEIEFNDFLLDQDSISIAKLFLDSPVVRLYENGRTVETVELTPEVMEDSMSSVVQLEVPIGLYIGNLKINNGEFALKKDKDGEVKDVSSINYDDLDIRAIKINADDLSISKSFEITSSINELQLIDQNDFEIKNLEVKEFGLSNEQLLLSDFSLETSNSSIQNYLEFNFDHFGDFSDFSRKIKIVSDMQNSELALRDLQYFFGDLSKNSFFRLNKNRSLYITGIVNGTIDNLEADQLDLRVDDKIRLQGAVSLSHLTDPKKALINMYVDELRSSMSGLNRVIPGFNPPEQFLKLDPIVFSGDIEGFFNDFVIYGALESALGNANLDTRLDTKGGVENAKYSGKLSLIDFDLATWNG